MTAYYNEIDPYAAQWLRNLISEGAIAPGDVDERDIRDVRPDELAGYTQCHFFAGIGVWSYALRLAGWPDDRPVWTGSCPCQPFSPAGKGKGFTDERHLWPHWYHLIEHAKQPDVPVFGEQVASKDGRASFDLVQADMERLDHTTGAVDLCAAGFGAPHIRQRLYWFSIRMGNPIGAELEGYAGHGDGETGWPVDTGSTPQTGNTCGMANGNPDRWSARCGNPGEEKGPRAAKARLDAERHRGSGGMADMPAIGCDGRSRSCNSAAREVRGAQGSAGQYDSRIAGSGTGPVNGFWKTSDWLFCRDGKWRAVEPSTFPLAHGLATNMGSVRPGEISRYRNRAPHRAGMLKGYGNAINAVQASAFIQASMRATL